MTIKSQSNRHLSFPSGRPVRDEFLVFGSPLIGEEEIAEVVATLRSGWLGTGARVHRFEEDFKRYIGCQHAIAVNSCTAGLHLALDVSRIGPGDLVITTPITFPATANVIVHRGAIPVFVDIDRSTQNLDPNQLEDTVRALVGLKAQPLAFDPRLALPPALRDSSCVVRRPKALIPVHMAGRPCNMDDIIEIAHRYDLVVIEDAAHALETWYGDRKMGTIGDITAFSFYVTKNVCTGEGGMVTTARDEWAAEIRLKSLHGISKDAWARYLAGGSQPYETIYPGYKANMMDLQAALGIHQLARVDKNLEVRERHWRRYNEAFADLVELITPIEEKGIQHARHLYTVMLNLDQLRCSRDQFIAALKALNIGTGVHFTSLHLHRYYCQTFGYRPGDLPNAEWVGERTVSLPLSAKLSDKDVEDVISAVWEVVEVYRR